MTTHPLTGANLLLSPGVDSGLGLGGGGSATSAKIIPSTDATSPGAHDSTAAWSYYIGLSKPISINLLPQSANSDSSSSATAPTADSSSAAPVPTVTLIGDYGSGFPQSGPGLDFAVRGSAKPGGGGGGSTTPPSSTTYGTGDALQFKVTYDSSVTGSSFVSQIESAFASVINNYFLANFSTPLDTSASATNPITISLHVGWGEAGGAHLPGLALGESNTNVMQFSYSDFGPTLNQSGTVSSVPSIPDPLLGITHNYVMATAEARAIGLTVPGATLLPGGFDGAVGFGSKFAWSFGTVGSDPVAANTYDFIGVAEHEVSETLGRIALLGQTVSAVTSTGSTVSVSNGYSPFDLLRFEGTTRSLTAGAAANCSINSGTSFLGTFNTGSGDAGDWQTPAQSALSSTGANDAYDAAAYPGYQYAASANDTTVVAALGYHTLALV